MMQSSNAISALAMTRCRSARSPAEGSSPDAGGGSRRSAATSRSLTFTGRRSNSPAKAGAAKQAESPRFDGRGGSGPRKYAPASRSPAKSDGWSSFSRKVDESLRHRCRRPTRARRRPRPAYDEEHRAGSQARREVEHGPRDVVAFARLQQALLGLRDAPASRRGGSGGWRRRGLGSRGYRRGRWRRRCWRRRRWQRWQWWRGDRGERGAEPCPRTSAPWAAWLALPVSPAPEGDSKVPESVRAPLPGNRRLSACRNLRVPTAR